MDSAARKLLFYGHGSTRQYACLEMAFKRDRIVGPFNVSNTYLVNLTPHYFSSSTLFDRACQWPCGTIAAMKEKPAKKLDFRLLSLLILILAILPISIFVAKYFNFVPDFNNPGWIEYTLMVTLAISVLALIRKMIDSAFRPVEKQKREEGTSGDRAAQKEI